MFFTFFGEVYCRSKVCISYFTTHIVKLALSLSLSHLEKRLYTGNWQRKIIMIIQIKNIHRSGWLNMISRVFRNKCDAALQYFAVVYLGLYTYFDRIQYYKVMNVWRFWDYAIIIVYYMPRQPLLQPPTPPTHTERLSFFDEGWSSSERKRLVLDLAGRFFESPAVDSSYSEWDLSVEKSNEPPVPGKLSCPKGYSGQCLPPYSVVLLTRHR